MFISPGNAKRKYSSNQTLMRTLMFTKIYGFCHFFPRKLPFQYTIASFGNPMGSSHTINTAHYIRTKSLKHTHKLSFIFEMEKNTSPSKNSPTKSPSPPPQNPPSDNDFPMETNHESPMETNLEAERTPPPPQNSPSIHDTPMETNPEAERIPPPVPAIKTALEVLAELSAGDEELGGNNEGENDGGNDASGRQDGGSVAVAIGGGGSLVIEGGSGGMSGDGQVRKRRNVQVRDPPPGNPRCPECGREFATWKAAFGHMRKHPERTHRGFFPPPSFNCPTNTFVPEFDDGIVYMTKNIINYYFVSKYK